MSLLGRIMNASNAFLGVTNIPGTTVGAPAVNETTWLPLGTAGASATGEVGVKVLVVGGSGGGGAAVITTGPISTTGTVSAVSVLSSSTTILAANAARKYAVICNNGTNDVFLARAGTAVSGSGILLKASGGSYEINSTNLYLGIICGISASSNSVSAEEDV